MGSASPQLHEPFPSLCPLPAAEIYRLSKTDKTFSSLCPGFVGARDLMLIFSVWNSVEESHPFIHAAACSLSPRAGLEMPPRPTPGSTQVLQPLGSDGVQGVMVLDFFACQKGIRKTKKMLSSELAASTRSISLGYLSCSCTLL